MPVTFKQLVRLVDEDLGADIAFISDELLESIVRSTLKHLDMHVNSKTGDVVSPVPPPSIVYSGVRTPASVRQTGVRYAGMRRRKGYRR